MSVTVASCTLAEIFNYKKIIASDGTEISGALTIPEYQRPYRWSEFQIKKLLNDYHLYLKDVAQSEVEYGYYLGSVILHQSAKNGCLNIIDGQQRITTLALIAFVQSLVKTAEGKKPFELSLSYDSPESQQQIMHNLAWLQTDAINQITTFDADKVNLTLVVTRSEDDAYRFFETQNTGGVRLSGPDIIKAHHLRSIDRNNQNHFASKWESLGDLNPIVGSLVKGRYWQNLDNRDVPSHRQPQLVRSAVVNELGEGTGKGSDISFGRFERIYLPDGGQVEKQDQQGYEMRQPLNSGINTIHYLAYFEGLRNKYLVASSETFSKQGKGSEAFLIFFDFYQEIICQVEGCSYLKGLYDTALLLYISQFGEQQLDLAAKKLFRVIYSPRVSNQKSVRENSISAFVRSNPVLDWVAASYTPGMCFEYLDRFSFTTDPANLDKDISSVKKRFVFKVLKSLEIHVDSELSAKDLAIIYTTKLNGLILSLGNGKFDENFGSKLKEKR